MALRQRREDHDQYASDGAGDAANDDSGLRAVNDAGLLQKVRLQKITEPGTPSGKSAYVAFFEPSKQ